MIWFQLLLFVALLFILVKSSDFFVEAIARIANYLGISEFVIGLTVVAIGTSLPELGASAMASAAGETELAIGNIIGSNMANIGMILGISTLFVLIKTNKRIFLRDCLLLLGISIMFYALSLDGEIGFIDGILLLSMVPIYLFYLFHSKAVLWDRAYKVRSFFHKVYHLNKLPESEQDKRLAKDLKKEKYEDFVGKGFDIESYENVRSRISLFKKSIAKDSIIVIACALLIYISAKYMIPIAVEIAEFFGVTKNVIGATIIAFGTSLPELSVSISSIKKGFSRMLMGNIIGSNIFNMALVGGISAIIRPLNVLPVTLAVSLPIMLLTTLLLFIFVRTGWRINKYEGMTLLALYLIFIAMLLIQG
jgi:cation:H+ antiporter